MSLYIRKGRIDILNVLIADDNIDYARNLLHFINYNCNTVRVSDISINGKETLDILNNTNNIDIVLLDLKMPFLNGIEIIKQLSPKQLNKYTNSFIIISGETALINQIELLKSKVVYKILPKCLELNFIMNNIYELVNEKGTKEKDEQIKVKILNELLSIGYSQTHSGTQYLIDIIEMAHFRGEYITKNLSKYAYPIIAKRHNQSSNNIKTSIIRSTEAMYYNCYEPKLLEYFKLSFAIQPNIRTIIRTVLLKIDG